MNIRPKLIKKGNGTYDFKHLDRNDLRVIHDFLGKTENCYTNKNDQLNVARTIRELITEEAVDVLENNDEPK